MKYNTKKRKQMRTTILIFITFVAICFANLGIAWKDLNAEIEASQTNMAVITYQADKTPTGANNALKSTSKRATLTKYLATGNKMANGEYPYVGACASSDRTIPFGTIIKWQGGECVVKDRTALWVHEKFGLTIDLYTEETEAEALQFGRQHLLVTIK